MPAASLVVLLVVAAVPAAVGQALPLGMGRITLQGRQNCPQGGLLTAQACGKSNSLSLSPGAATTLSTWIIDRAQALLPGDVGVPVNFKVKGRAQCPATSFLTGVIGCDNKSIFMGAGSRFVLEKVPGVNLYRIRMQGRATGRCTRTYLGAAKACGDPKISVYSATDTSVLTVWRLDVDSFPPPPTRRPPPRRPPPKVQPVRINPPPMVKRAPPPPRRSPPPRRAPPPPRRSPPPAPDNGDGTCSAPCGPGKFCSLGMCLTIAPFAARLRWNDNIDLDLEVFAPNGCHMYYDYRGIAVDGDCRALGASLEYDCRSFRECPVGMQEYIPIKIPVFGNYTIRVHDFTKLNPGTSFTLDIYRDGVVTRLDDFVDYSCKEYPESKCFAALYP